MSHAPRSVVPLPPPALAWSVATLVALAAVLPAMLSAGAASARARREEAILAAARRDAMVVLTARAAAPARSSQGLAEAAIAAMTRAGIDRTALEGLAPDASESGAGHSAVRRRATLTLRCTLPQLGRLLLAIPDLAPGWIPSGVDLTPVEPGRDAPAGPKTLRAVLTLEGVFAQEEQS